MRFLTPTDNKRLNELIGFLCIVFAILVALALISYSPHDTSLNVSSAPGENGVMTRNWIGPVGAYCADLIFQVFGFAAFLLPVAICDSIVRLRNQRMPTTSSATGKRKAAKPKT